MKQVCNIFNPIDKENGNFLLFSQYVEDVSKSIIESDRKVRPSRFVCMDFDKDVLDSAYNKTQISELSESNDYTQFLPRFFQNQFENGISAMKKNGIENITPYSFSVSFLSQLTALCETIDLKNYIKYISNINYVSWQDGFADIILDINSGAKNTVVVLKDSIGGVSLKSGSDPISTSDFMTNCCGSITYPNIQGTDTGKYYIHGWKDQNLKVSALTHNEDTTGGNLSELHDRGYAHGESINNSVFDLTYDFTEGTEQGFTFNTILVLYDIENNDGETLYKDIPMGIYFTGKGNNDVSTPITNPITIHTSDAQVYGAGSGWSLRICTKFSPIPYGKLQVEEVALESNSFQKSISALMNATGEAIKTVNDFANKVAVNSRGEKDLYNMFKNSRTNVPYIRTVNGKDYWFVNGRNTGVGTILEFDDTPTEGSTNPVTSQGIKSYVDNATIIEDISNAEIDAIFDEGGGGGSGSGSESGSGYLSQD